MNMWDWFKRGVKIALVLALVFTAGAFAADAAPTAPVEAASSWKELLITAAIAIAGFGGTVITFFFNSLRSKVAKTDEQNQAWSLLEAGVTSAYHNLYDDLKAKRSDGKLTDEDKAALRAHAIQVAKDLATGPALNMLKVTALPILQDWVERIVLKRKEQAGTAAGSETVPPAISAT